MKMPKKNSSKKNDQESSEQSSSLAVNRCCFETSDGRRCRLVRSATHPTLCLFHARDEQQLLESHRLGAEISSSLTGDFMIATDVNYVLGKLFTALAQNRIPRRNAATLAYRLQVRGLERHAQPLHPPLQLQPCRPGRHS
jgi:hypothetical protein